MKATPEQKEAAVKWLDNCYGDEFAEDNATDLFASLPESGEVKRLQKRQKEAQSEYDRLKADLHGREATIMDQQHMIDGLRKELAALKAEPSEDVVEKLANGLEHIEEYARTILAAIGYPALLAKLKAAKAENAKLSAKNAELVTRIDAECWKVKELKDQLDGCNLSYETANNRIRELTEEVKQLQADYHVARIEADTQYVAVVKVLDRAADRIKELHAELAGGMWLPKYEMGKHTMEEGKQFLVWNDYLKEWEIYKGNDWSNCPAHYGPIPGEGE